MFVFPTHLYNFSKFVIIFFNIILLNMFNVSI